MKFCSELDEGKLLKLFRDQQAIDPIEDCFPLVLT